MRSRKPQVALMLGLALAMVLVGGPAWAHDCDATSDEVEQGVTDTGNSFALGTDEDDVIDCSSSAVGHAIEGNGGNDVLLGGFGRDFIYGGPGDDIIEGRAGNDYLEGDEGDDNISGGAGNDYIVAGSGRDRVSGGGGNDVIVAVDGEADRIDCGPGTDDVYFDAGLDVVTNCERLYPY